MPRRSSLPAALAGACFLAYAAVSVGRHLRLRTTGFDLGIFEEAVRGYAFHGAPIVALKGPGYQLLGDHFHPALAVLAPAYRLVPSPITLLVAQAGLLAVSVLPVTRFAIGVAGRAAGAGLGLGYGLSFGLQQAVGFDFHEVCLAVPLLAFGGVALAERRWRAGVVWTLPLVLVKEDLPLTVAAVGAYLLWRRQWRPGLLLVGLGVAAFAVIVTVVIPAFGDGYAYASTVSTAGAVRGWDSKARTLVWLLAPTALLALRSPLLVLALPTLAWRFTSGNPGYWGTGYHYDAVLMPIVFVAFADAVSRLRRSSSRAGAVAVGLAVTLAMCPLLPLRDLVRPAAWHEVASAGAARAVLDAIPPGASVAATNALAAQLTARCTVYLFPRFPDAHVRPEWVALLDHPDTSLVPAADVRAGLDRLPGLGYERVVHRDGIDLYRLGPSIHIRHVVGAPAPGWRARPSAGSW